MELHNKARAEARITAIPTQLMTEYVRRMQMRLRAKKIGYKKEFIREILKEVRVKGKAVRLTYKLPMTVRTPLAEGKDPKKEEFFTQRDSVKNHFYTSRSVYRKIAYRCTKYLDYNEN